MSNESVSVSPSHLQAAAIVRRRRLVPNVGGTPSAAAEPSLATSREHEFSIASAGGMSLSRDVFAAYELTDAPVEALRSLRTHLVLGWFRSQTRRLAIVGARADSGASELVANLAVMFAQLGEKVLLIDADLRHPRQHRLFGLGDGSGSGLSNVLAGHGSLAEFARCVKPFENLSVLCAGPLPSNPQELLSGSNFSQLMDSASASYGVVLVDAPPVLDYADAQLVVARTGACIISTRRDYTRVDDVKAAKAQTDATGAVTLGAVITD